VYSTCLACTRDLGANDVLETLPIGRRVAFDSAQGRLWVVCPTCGKWNLVPFDNRLESIDACERLFRDTPTRFSTDQIGLARVREGLELVRIGAPQRPEFASWRYGSEYRRRRRRSLTTSTLAMLGGAGAYAGLEFMTGGTLSGSTPGLIGTILGLSTLYNGSQVALFIVDSRRMKIKTVHPETGERVTLHRSGVPRAVIEPDGDNLILKVPRMILSANPLEFTGEPAEQLTRRILGRINMSLGTKSHLNTAVARVPTLLAEDQGSLLRATFNAGPVRSGLGAPTHLSQVPAGDRLALEMFANESDERRWLTGELALLERQWKEAEELAKIADSLAVTDDVSRAIDHR